ncbi:MAG: T9SS type A sorting domain-containing protein [Bacteroidota bacterium]
MKKVPLLFTFCLLGCLLFQNNVLWSQSGCPGCLVNVPDGLPEDTIFLQAIPDGEKGQYYDEDISFRLPKTTTPVAATDPDVPSGVNINEIFIKRITNLPPGLSWEVDRDSYDPGDESDGCMKLCGIPLVTGVYVIDVVIEAKVSILTREASFQIRMEILPKSNSNDGFTILNSTGCGETVASFTNNIPSNGQPGFSYLWDFGNGITSLDENPLDQTYTEPGIYVVKYMAFIDTAGYILTNAELISSSCDDTFSDPDIVLEIKDPNDDLLFKSEEFENTSPPIDVNVNLRIGDGTYQFIATDKDSGLEFGDDECANTSFNRLSNDTLRGNGFTAKLTIIHNVDTVRFQDTIIVYELPLAPVTDADGPTTFCRGDSVVLSTLTPGVVQWYFNDSLIQGADLPEFVAYEGGNYQVEVTTAEGCQVVSDPLSVLVNELPDLPVFTAERNELLLDENVVLPTNYSLQWLYEGMELPGEVENILCATASGTYDLIVTDLNTGCRNRYARSIAIDPDIDCTVGVGVLGESSLSIFPNPTNGLLNVQLEGLSNVSIRLYDLLGRQILERSYQADILNETLDLSALQAGIYLLAIEAEGVYRTERIVKQ